MVHGFTKSFNAKGKRYSARHLARNNQSVAVFAKRWLGISDDVAYGGYFVWWRSATYTSGVANWQWAVRRAVCVGRTVNRSASK